MLTVARCFGWTLADVRALTMFEFVVAVELVAEWNKEAAG